MGGRESELFHSTEEAGELIRRTLWREGESRNTGPLEGKMAGIPRPGDVSTRRQRIAVLRSETVF